MTETGKSAEYEYAVDSQWAGWWGGYGAERLLEHEINQRASEGWRLIDVESQTFFWWGLAIVPLWIFAKRTKLLYIYERAK